MQNLNLRELAERVGMRPRTVRSYIEKDLLPGPGTSGPKANYGYRHLERLKAIKVLREYDGLSLEETRQRLLALGDKEIREFAERFDEWEARPEADLAKELQAALQPEARPAPEAGGTAPRAMHREGPSRAGPMITETGASSGAFSKAMSAPSSRWKRLSRDSNTLFPTGHSTPRRSRAEPMTRITITPDVDLVVRGVHDERQIERLERVADFVRKALLGAPDE